MPLKSGSGKKADSTCSREAGEKDLVIRDLKNRLAILEKELQSWRGESGPRKIADRKEDDPALDETDGFKSSVLDAMPSNIALLDGNGVIVYVNKSWSIFARQNGAAPEYVDCVGINYLDVCRSATGTNSEEAPLAVEGLCAVIRGDRESFELEYPCHSPDVKRWFQMHVIPLYSDGHRGILVYHNDVTKGKLAELALREGELKFRQMAENIGEVFFIFSTDWKHTIYVSPAYERVWGRPLKDVYHNSMDWLGGVHPDDIGLPQAVVSRNIGGDVPGTDKVEFRVVRPDGSVRWIFARTFPIRDEQGALSGITGIAEDITERKRAEEALHDSERRFRGIYEQAPLGIALIDSITGHFLQVNQKYCDIIGLTQEAMLVTDFQSITHPDDLQEDLDNMARLLRGEIKSFNMEKRYLHANGSIVWVSLTVVPLWEADSSYKHHIAMVEDITERKFAEEALADSRRMLQLVIDNIPQAIFWKDINSVYLGCNKVLAHDVGLKSPGDIVGKTDYDLSTTREQTESYRAYDRMVMDRGEPVYHIIEEQRRADGTVAWLETNKVPLHDESGNVIGILCTYEDITGRKKAEQALADAKEQAELYLDLMGHDINNMHQIALGYLELARDMQADAGKIELLDKPIEVLQRSAQLIKNVQKLQKLKEDMFQSQDIDICQFLVDVQREFGAVPGKTITLNLNRCDRCHIRANELLHDVFSNLVGNAIKHSGDRADIKLILNIVNDKGSRYCQVSVEDDGPGIPDDFKGKIFNRLLKGSENAKGMGLGLYLVKSLVNSYGGRVWVEDRVAGDYTKGARFVVMLPAIDN
jgi:PAS domain S-box-containing protein